MKRFLYGCLILTSGLGLLPLAHATGVFTTPRFVETGNFALGLEPDLILTDGAGLGFNGRFTYGLTDLNNVTAILGTGGGPERFRVGGNVTFDFFPDIEGQPGIGIATQALYFRLPDAGELALTALPYIHKTFISGSNEFEPYFSFPFGLGFSQSNYRGLATVVVGSMFKASDHLRYDLELGVAVNNTESYVSGGITYYH